MEVDSSKLFHQSSKDRFRGHQPVPEKYEDWPEEWKATHYKIYPRLLKIGLDDGPPSADFFDLIKARRSSRDFHHGAVLNKHELSILLKYSCGTKEIRAGKTRRAQPSGGGQFPIEVYPIIFRSGADLETGLYHYNVKEHNLDTLWTREFSGDQIDELFSYTWVKNAAAVIIMTGVFQRNQSKYGERGYRMILQESGHIAQNMYLISTALNLKCCSLIGTKDQALEELIDIDGITESVVYAFAVGK